MHLSYFLCSTFAVIIHCNNLHCNFLTQHYFQIHYFQLYYFQLHCDHPLSLRYLPRHKKMIRTIPAAVHALLYAKITPKYD